MKSLFIRAICVCVVAAAFAIAGYGQDQPERVTDRGGSRNPAVIVVGSAAKAAWVTTKFVAKDVALPVAKFVVIKAAPRAGLFVLKRSPRVAKRILPVAVKLALL